MKFPMAIAAVLTALAFSLSLTTAADARGGRGGGHGGGHGGMRAFGGAKMVIGGGHHHHHHHRHRHFYPGFYSYGVYTAPSCWIWRRGYKVWVCD